MAKTQDNIQFLERVGFTRDAYLNKAFNSFTLPNDQKTFRQLAGRIIKFMFLDDTAHAKFYDDLVSENPLPLHKALWKHADKLDLFTVVNPATYLRILASYMKIYVSAFCDLFTAGTGQKIASNPLSVALKIVLGAPFFLLYAATVILTEPFAVAKAAKNSLAPVFAFIGDVLSSIANYLGPKLDKLKKRFRKTRLGHYIADKNPDVTKRPTYRMLQGLDSEESTIEMDDYSLEIVDDGEHAKLLSDSEIDRIAKGDDSVDHDSKSKISMGETPAKQNSFFFEDDSERAVELDLSDLESDSELDTIITAHNKKD